MEKQTCKIVSTRSINLRQIQHVVPNLKYGPAIPHLEYVCSTTFAANPKYNHYTFDVDTEKATNPLVDPYILDKCNYLLLDPELTTESRWYIYLVQLTPIHQDIKE